MFKTAQVTLSALGLALSLGLAAPAAQAQTLSFSNWQDQRFQLFNRVSFGKSGQTLRIQANDAASMTYSVLPSASWGARAASWNWSVSQSVPPTKLDQRGGDDRNIAIYFAFVPQDVANGMGSNPSLRSLLNNPAGRVLVYVHGGNQGRGTMLRTPYLENRGMVVIRRPAGTGSNSESVDLAADYARAFGGSPEALIAVAISADSDDTGSVIDASVSGLTIR